MMKWSGDYEDLFSSCEHCRNYKRKICNDRRYRLAAEAKATKELLYQQPDIKTISCPGRYHTTASDLPRDVVPVENFRKTPDDPRSTLYNQCSDCRQYEVEINAKRRIKNKILAEEQEGLSMCTECRLVKRVDEMTVDPNGTITTSCKKCKTRNLSRRGNVKKMINSLKLERIILQACSCRRCKCIYLTPREGTAYAVRLETYELEDDVPEELDDDTEYIIYDTRIVDYEGVTYFAEEFIEAHADELEFSILEYDHMTEEEQRDSYMLLPDEPFVPKKNTVGRAGGRDTMRLESRKCQLLCGKCHVEVTIEREIGASKRLTEKRVYVDELKIKIGKCEICGDWDPDLLPFFEFDHTDPSEKVEKIAELVQRSKYTLDHVKDEIKKCRLICKHCHRIHTVRQKERGIIR